MAAKFIKLEGSLLVYTIRDRSAFDKRMSYMYGQIKTISQKIWKLIQLSDMRKVGVGISYYF